MRSKARYILAMTLLILAGTSAQAQVEKAAARSTRPLWGSCGATVKAALERQAGVAEVIIDMQSNVVFVTYHPNTHFEPAVLRKAAEEAETTFPLIQIVCRGRIVEEGAKHFLVAGEDRFLLIEPPASAPPLPAASDALLSVVASVDDSAYPIKLKIVQSKPAEP